MILTTATTNFKTLCKISTGYLRLITMALAIGFCSDVSAQSWNIATGGNTLRNGLSAISGPSEETLLWSGGLQSSISGAPVSDSIYLATVRIHNLSNPLEGSKIVMMNILTGDTLWTKNLPIDFPATDWRNKLSALRNGVLYASRSGNSNEAYLYALNAADGTILWQSESLIDESNTEGANFSPDGDLIIGNTQSILRINQNDGSTVWEVSRLSYQNASEVAVHGSKFYGIINDQQELKVATFNLSDGQLLYSSEGLDNGLVQQHGLFVAPDGTIYLPRSQNNPITDYLYSFTDTGESLQQNWNIPIYYVPFSTSACGPDGSIYSYSRSGKVIRIDPDLGEVTDSSMVVLFGDANCPRMAIDAAGRVHMTNGGFDDGNFYSFNADLSLRWQTPVTNVFIGGPIIGHNGTMVLCGIGNDIRAYVGDSDATSAEYVSTDPSQAISLFPNPAHGSIQLKCKPTNIGLTYTILDNMGKSVLSETIISEITTLDVTHLASGMYFVIVENESFPKQKFIKE